MNFLKKIALMSAFLFVMSSAAFAAGLTEGQEIKLWGARKAPGSENVNFHNTVIERSKDPKVHDRAMVHIDAPHMVVKLPKNPNGTAVVVGPGGGYARVVIDKEGDDIANWLTKNGVTVFILRYRLPEDPHNKNREDVPLEDGQRAIRIVRAHASEWGLNPNKIGIAGFSAGGHLAASLAVHWNKNFVKEPLGFTEEHKPDSLILAYPVISSTDTHQGSIDNLLAEDSYLPLGGLESTFGIGYLKKEDREELISLEKHVSADTPKSFIWHCADDGCVPVSNSLRFAAALNNHHIPFAMHIYQNGGHGLALGDEVTAKEESQINVDAAGWIKLVCDWIYRK